MYIPSLILGTNSVFFIFELFSTQDAKKLKGCEPTIESFFFGGGAPNSRKNSINNQQYFGEPTRYLLLFSDLKEARQT